MGSLENLDSLLRTQDCIVLLCAGKIVCGCSKQFTSLSALAEHISRAHVKLDKKHEDEEAEEGLQEYFRKHFQFPQENKNAVSVTLPEDITCVCLGEHDIGAFASNIKCHICNKLCEDLDTLNKHIASVHRMSHILVGHNITFEKPDASHVKPAFYCPMVKCKYHIAESFQNKYFKSFKLLKQHYIKIHANKQFPCTKCNQKFASKTYLDIHSKNCGEEFSCSECGSKFLSYESLQTHCRRKGHIMDPLYQRTKVNNNNSKANSKPSTRDPALDKLAILQGYQGPGKVPIAPKPSPMHINAAIALSELSATQTFTPKADIGVQTDADIWRHRKSCTPSISDPGLLSPNKRHSVNTCDHDLLVSTETQTKTGGRKRSYKVSSQVQTLGEFSVRAKRAKMEEDQEMSTTETQCRMSPAKKIKIDLCSVTTMTNMSNVLDLDLGPPVNVPEADYLWPLRCHTNGTQTSPRMAQLPRQLSDDDDDDDEDDKNNSDVDDLGLPTLETVDVVNACSKPKLGEIRQFSTETQTELDIFLDNYDDVENLLTTEMETQTHEDDENLLLFANNYTQTGTEDFLSALIIGGDTDTDRRQHHPDPSIPTNSNPFKMDYVCSAETQTRLTGFQEPSLLLQIGNNQVKLVIEFITRNIFYLYSYPR